MKAYIAVKKANKEQTGEIQRMQYGLTVYSNEGKVLHSSVLFDEVSENKFESALKAIDWAIRKIKTMTQNRSLSDSEDIVMVIGSKTIHGWFAREVAPEPYTILLSDILLEMSFLLNSLEIIHSENGEKRVLYRNSEEDKGTRATDLFAGKV